MYFVGFLCTFAAWLMALAWIPIAIVAVVAMIGEGAPDATLIVIILAWPILTFGIFRLGRNLRIGADQSGTVR
ncbi:hypothetical protein [Dongia sp.]|uniref:hypothetical protein n=1 Tax=Dongia sp. TaxID=1977262 RepID=UPI003750C128